MGDLHLSCDLVEAFQRPTKAARGRRAGALGETHASIVRLGPRFSKIIEYYSRSHNSIHYPDDRAVWRSSRHRQGAEAVPNEHSGGS